MNVFSALHPIDDSSDHNGKINEDAAHTHEPLRVECIALVISSPIQVLLKKV